MIYFQLWVTLVLILLMPAFLVYRGSRLYSNASIPRLYRRIRAYPDDTPGMVGVWIEREEKFEQWKSIGFQFSMAVLMGLWGWWTEGPEWGIVLGLFAMGLGMVIVVLIPPKVDQDVLWNILDGVFQMARNKQQPQMMYQLYWAALQLGSERGTQKAFEWARQSENNASISLMDRLLKEWGLGPERGEQMEAELHDVLMTMAVMDNIIEALDLQSDVKSFFGGAKTKALAFYDEQEPFREAPEKAFCQRCRVRSEVVDLSYTQVAICPQCHEWDAMVGDVETVVGVIGMEKEMEILENEVRISLWNAPDQTVTVAEIERLEVVAGTQINYDWAVGAVMEALRNHFPDTTTDLPYVVDPSLQLSANSLNLLSNT